MNQNNLQGKNYYQEAVRLAISRGHPELAITGVLSRGEWRDFAEPMGHS